jgi:2-keto-4-pentenoate hydratase
MGSAKPRASPSDPLSVARWLMQEHASGRRFEPFAARFGIDTMAAAYAVQHEFVALQASARGVPRAGYKIGLTSPAMQARCGIDTPVAGVVLGDRVHASGVRLARASHVRFGIEFEIAVRLGRDLRPTGRPFTPADVQGAIDGVAPAIEIVDDRGCDYASLDVFSLVADNAWNAGIVLGAFRSGWPDLAEVTGEVSVDGAGVLDRGRGRDVLGHPLRPVAWLADHLAGVGASLLAGDVVMTGSLVTTKFPGGPGHYRFEVSGLGAAEVSLL